MDLEKNNRIILIDQLILKNDIEKTRSNNNKDLSNEFAIMNSNPSLIIFLILIEIK